MEDSEGKLREMVLYAAKGLRDVPDWSLTRLFRVLFHSDFRAYRLLGHSLSGRVYRKEDQAPAPEGILSVLSQMEREGLCAWSGGERCRRLLALREPDLMIFSPEESDLLKVVLEVHRNLGIDEVGEFSDGFYGWEAAFSGEEIPYGTASVGRPRPLTPQEVEWAQEAIQEYLERILPPNRQRAAV